MTSDTRGPNLRLAARNAAVNELIKRHKTEFDTHMIAEYKNRGLGEYTPTPTPEEREAAKKRAQIAKAQEKVNKAKAELDALTTPEPSGLDEFRGAVA
jgi:hypothetical protein